MIRYFLLSILKEKLKKTTTNKQKRNGHMTVSCYLECSYLPETQAGNHSNSDRRCGGTAHCLYSGHKTEHSPDRIFRPHIL